MAMWTKKIIHKSRFIPPMNKGDFSVISSLKGIHKDAFAYLIVTFLFAPLERPP